MPRIKNKYNEWNKQNIAYRKAIRAKCVDCMCGQKLDCLVADCPLYPFRPYREQK